MLCTYCVPGPYYMLESFSSLTTCWRSHLEGTPAVSPVTYPLSSYTRGRLPQKLPPQNMGSASRSGAVPRRFSWNALLYREPREFPTDSILKQPAIPQWETLAAFLFCHRPWVLGFCLPICVVRNDKAYPSRAVEPLGRKCLKSLAYRAGSVT